MTNGILNEIVRAIVREVRELDHDTKRTIAQHTSQHGSLDPSIDQGVATALLVNHLFLRRNKRCLLAYHRVRTQKLEDLAWCGGDLMDEQQIQAGRVQNVDALSPEEEEYFRQYNEMLIS
ncbi:DNA replication protein psf1, partial [Ascosphaera pollenicola]